MSMKLNRRAFLGTALTFGALCSVSPAEAFGVTAAEKKKEVQAIKAKLDSMLDELDQAVDKYNAAQDAYEKATNKVENAKAQIKEAQGKIDTLQGHLATRATSMYRTGSMSYLDVLLGVGSFDDFATVWDTLNTLNEDDADLVTETKQAKAKLEAAKKELDEQQSAAANHLAEAKSYHKSIQGMADKYESEYNSLSSEYRKLLKEEEAAEAKRREEAANAYRPTTTPSHNSGGSSGGMDIVGMCLTRRYKGISVGKVSLAVNTVIYGICALLFGVQTFVYSLIYSVVSMLMTDRTHTQNINSEVVIFTKKEPTEIIDYIVQEFHRDATWWEARGGYTEERTYMVIVILSKYECAHLRREIKMVDEHAFVVVKDNMSIHGKYEKHLM